ncbi:hypothetical protein KKA03_03095 [archaeon]|nr:hypothetical protein [archaeon]
MPKIVKNVGHEEDFKPGKLKLSVTKAGVSDEVAQKIMRSIKVEEGMKSSKLRNEIISHLNALEPQAAKKYQAFRKPVGNRTRN